MFKDNSGGQGIVPIGIITYVLLAFNGHWCIGLYILLLKPNWVCICTLYRNIVNNIYLFPLYRVGKYDKWHAQGRSQELILFVPAETTNQNINNKKNTTRYIFTIINKRYGF